MSLSPVTAPLDPIIAKFIELFYYDNGKLIRKIDRGQAFKAGDVAGYYDKSSGYLRVGIDGKNYLVHRVIYALNYLELPKYIDHINKNKLDNRIENLRPATTPQNIVNSDLRKDNTQNYKGVVNHKMCKGWTAQGSDINGKRVHLGVFLSKEEAALAYNYHAEKTYGKYATFNQVFEDVEVHQCM